MSRDNKTNFNKFCDILGYIAVSSLFFISKFIPIYIFSLFFGCLAVIFCPFIPATYIAWKNLKNNTDLSVFERILMIVKIWYNLGSFAGEYPYVYRIKKGKIFDYISIEDPEQWEKIKAQNGIIISGHISNWEFGLRLLSELNIKTNVVFRKLNNPYLEPKYMTDLRSSIGVKMIAKQDNAALKIVRALKNKENVIILADQRDAMNGILLNFFKNKAYTIETIYTISKRLNVPVYAMRVVRTGFVKFIAKFEEFDTSVDDKNEFLQNMNDLLERWIKEHMAQWFWVHDRWKL